MCVCAQGGGTDPEWGGGEGETLLFELEPRHHALPSASESPLSAAAEAAAEEDATAAAAAAAAAFAAAGAGAGDAHGGARERLR